MKKMKYLLLFFVCLFALGTLTACGEDNNEDNNQNVETNGGNVEDTPNPPTVVPSAPESTIDVQKVTFEDTTAEYTGEPISFTVKNLPGGVSVEYTYLFEGNEVTEMIELGEYEVTAVIKDKVTGEELRTLSAVLTIEPKKIVDEIPNDADSNIELTYTTHYVQMRKNPDDETQLIAAGLELYASETIYFVLDRKTGASATNYPLNFLELDEASVECASIVDNTLVISEPGTYDVIMMFPEESLVPVILVRQGADSNVFYFRGTMNNYEVSEEYTFTVDETNNTASYEIELKVDDVFKIANYYYSVSFDYSPYFQYMPDFAAGGEYGNDVLVKTSGTYKFIIDLSNKTLAIYLNNEELIADKDLLYFRGTMNGYGLTHPFAKKNGIATIEIELKENDVFAIGDAEWTKQYGFASFFSSMNAYFAAGGEYGDDIKVLQAGNYKFELNINENKVTVYKDGTEVGTQTGSSGGNGNVVGSYALIITHADGTKTQVTLQPWENFGDYAQHFGDNVVLQVGDIITLYDIANKVEWVEKVIDPYGQHANFTATDQGIKCNVAGTYDFYIKFKWEDNMIYIGNEQGA